MTDDAFSWRATKDGHVRIACRARVVTTLAGSQAERFLQRIANEDRLGSQALMARATGHFKHGNERQGRR
jgi:hypothetical protein